MRVRSSSKDGRKESQQIDRSECTYMVGRDHGDGGKDVETHDGYRLEQEDVAEDISFGQLFALLECWAQVGNESGIKLT